MASVFKHGTIVDNVPLPAGWPTAGWRAGHGIWVYPVPDVGSVNPDLALEEVRHGPGTKRMWVLGLPSARNAHEYEDHYAEDPQELLVKFIAWKLENGL